jgi:ATP-dependent protease HslVU (ClpYQ) peptidase subunit
MTAEEIVREAMRITEEICIFTNKELSVEVARAEEEADDASSSEEDV